MSSSSINIRMNFQNDSELKQLEILDSDLNIVASEWISEPYYNTSVKEGIYAVRITDLSGLKYLRSFTAGKEPNIIIDIENEGSENKERYKFKTHGREELEIKSLKNFDYPYEHKFNFDEKFINKFLIDSYVTNIFPVSIFNEGNINQAYKINTKEKPNSRLYLKYGTINFLVKLPVNEDLIVIASKNHSKKSSHELCFTIELQSKEIEMLLRMLSAGEMGKAKSLFKHINFAENLLYNKIENPSYASLGGYFLLRTNSVDNLHHWPKNLADWFEWLPDGCIIHATQLMRGQHPDLGEVRKYLLKAYQRGVPQFTDGLKLLHEGLMRLYYINERDEVIADVYKEVRNWLSCADPSSAFTVLRSKADKNYK